jgi:hypothetical protein
MGRSQISPCQAELNEGMSLRCAELVWAVTMPTSELHCR